MIETLTNIVGYINSNILWGIPMIVAILTAGIVMTIRSHALQVRKFGDSISTTIVPTVKSIFKKNKTNEKKATGEKSISQFEAFSAAISGTVGTGNIVGVAGALISGGPGAVFWMWVSAFFGLITNYSENVLGLYYRRRDKDGNFSGGPMYYISNGLGWKWLAKIFAFCCGLAALGMGMVQSNSISGTLQNTISGGDDLTLALIIGCIIVLLAAAIIIGGIKRIGKVASYIVPFMALLFIIMALLILVINVTAIPSAFALIFKSAFNFKAVGGGFLGYMIMTAMRYGFARGIFSNEAGLGSSVIAHSASETREPVKQGLWGIFEVFLDTFVICTLTAITLLVTASKSGYDFLAFAGEDKNMVAPTAFVTSFGTFGTVVFSIILPLFAFTTILAWSYYGQKAIEYLFGKFGKTAGVVFKVIFVLLLLVGAMVKSGFVWELDDMFNALMAIPNLIGVILLSGTIVKISKNYYDRKKGINVEPMLSAYPDLNEEFKADIARQHNAD